MINCNELRNVFTGKLFLNGFCTLKSRFQTRGCYYLLINNPHTQILNHTYLVVKANSTQNSELRTQILYLDIKGHEIKYIIW